MQFQKLVMQLFIFLTLFIVFAQYNLVYSQDKIQPSPTVVGVPGPPMVCGTHTEVNKIINFFSEQKFMVLMDKENEDEGLYYILYRNSTTGTWSLVAYNLENVSSNISCVLNGGYRASILPNGKSIKKMLKQQDKGFEKVKKRGIAS